MLIGSHLEEAFNVATSVSAEQGVLYEEKMQAIENEESNFFGSILLQRDQEVSVVTRTKPSEERSDELGMGGLRAPRIKNILN